MKTSFLSSGLSWHRRTTQKITPIFNRNAILTSTVHCHHYRRADVRQFNNRTNLNGRPGTAGTAGCTSPRLSQNNSRSSLLNPNSPAPFDWLHFEGRSVKTTLSNIIGLDGLARERKWRSYCVFSLDVGRKARQGVEAVCGSAEPHEEHFIHSSYVAHSPRGCCVPEQILRTDAFPRLCRLAAYFSIVVGLDGSPHALLVGHWGKDGGSGSVYAYP